MKRLISLVLIVFLGASLFAQGFKINEAPRALNSGTYASYLFELPDVTKKQADEDWKAFMSDFKAKTKYDRKTSTWTSTEVKMPRISDTPITVYAKIIEDSNPKRRTSVIVWFATGGSYVARMDQSAKADYAHEILTEYAMTTSKQHALNIVKAEEKVLKGLETDMKKLVKNNSDYHKEIEKAKELIAKHTKDIEINEADQKSKKKEVEDQKSKVGEAKKNVKRFNR